MSRHYPAPFLGGYGQHSHTWWQSHSVNPDLPAWFRVAAWAYGNHRKNGHAHAGAGVLEDALASVNRATGMLSAADASNVNRAIRDAVARGLLAEGSNRRCLIVPHGVAGGRYGTPTEPCDRHGQPVQAQGSVAS